MDQHCVIIGAGFSGLAAAERLRAAGVGVTVVEARDRIGGRTRVDQLAGRTVDVGGQWIGAAHTQLAALAGRAGVTTRQQFASGHKLLHLGPAGGGSLKRYRGTIPNANPVSLIELELALRALARCQRQLDVQAPWQAAQARAWDAMTLRTWVNRRLRTASARAIFDIATRSVMTAEAGVLSFLGFVFYCESNGGFESLTTVDGGAQARVVEGGMVQLADHLAAPLRQDNALVLDTPVRAVTSQSSGGRLTVHGATGEWHADRVICALAPAVTDRIAFEPALPVARQRLAQSMPMGSVIKVVIAYDRPFWREAGLSGEAVSHAMTFNTVFDASPDDGSRGVLVGFIDGAPAQHWTTQPAAERRQAVLDSLVRYFGPQAAHPLDLVEHDWLADPWARGCYVGLMPPGLLTELGPALRTPAGRIHWAGTETATAFCGYIEGAIRAGRRAADEVIQALG